MILGKRLVTALAAAAAVAVPVFVYAARGGGGFGGHGGGGVHFSAPAGGFARGGHFTGADGNWSPHPNWGTEGSFEHWQGGHWWHGTYQGRLGFWWVVGADWYWYPGEVAATPDPYTPPGVAPGYWYWCPTYNAYYPYVVACPVAWVPEALQ